MLPLQNASTFLIQTLFDIYLIILLLRLIFQYLRIDYYNPVTQFVVKATNRLVVPLRRIIPGYWGIDFATVFVIIGVLLLKLLLITFVQFYKLPDPAGLLLWSMGDLAALIIKLFFFAIIINVILSWVAPRSYSPITTIIYHLTDPLMRPARRFVRPIGGFDISPIVVIIFLQLLLILFADPLWQLGYRLAMR